MVPISKIRMIVDRHRDGVDQLFIRYNIPLPVTPENVFEVAAQLGVGFTNDLLRLGNKRATTGFNYTGSNERAPSMPANEDELHGMLQQAYDDGAAAERSTWIWIVVGISIFFVIVLFIAIHYAGKAKKV